MTKILVTGGSGFIGTNLIESLILAGHEVVNLDLTSPLDPSQVPYWVEGDLFDLPSVKNAFEAFKPEWVVHLAARTDTLSDRLEDYEVNTKGTANLLEAVKSCSSIRRVLVTSTQYVYKSADRPFPSHDTDFKPHTIYGQSKVITEQLTRDADLECEWCIIRPTNIWGPWHMRYPKELWRVIAKGHYVHPGKAPVIRTYGYVKNIVHQMEGILAAPASLIQGKVYYLGDLPIDSYLWLNEISQQVRERDIHRVPKICLRFPAWIGDVLMKCGIRFPLHSVRFANMVEDFYAPTDLTVSLFGLRNENLEKNIAETLHWIKDMQSCAKLDWRN